MTYFTNETIISDETALELLDGDMELDEMAGCGHKPDGHEINVKGGIGRVHNLACALTLLSEDQVSIIYGPKWGITGLRRSTEATTR